MGLLSSIPVVPSSVDESSWPGLKVLLPFELPHAAATTEVSTAMKSV
jgi:hypothetical protein